MDLYHFRLYYAVLSFLVALGSPASLVCDVFLCFITFPYGVSGRLWYLIVSIPDLCLLHYY